MKTTDARHRPEGQSGRRTNRRRFAALGAGAALGLVLSFASAAAAAPPRYELAKTVQLGPPNHWDYIVFSPSDGRVYAAHGTEVTVIDGTTGKVLGQLTGLHDSHGIAPVPSAGRVYADSGKNHMVFAYDAKTFRRLGGTSVVADADGMTYVPAMHEVIVVGGDAQAASAINAETGKPVATIPLGGSPEGVAAGAKGIVFVAIEDKRLIDRIDTTSNTVTARWPIPSCAKPHGIAVDPAHDRVFVSCENGRMLAVDASDGNVVAQRAIGYGSDTAAFDPKTGLAFSSNRDGTLSVVREQSANDFVDLGAVRTELGARTMAVDPANGRVFTMTEAATPAHPDQAGHAPELRYEPGTLHMLFYDPAPQR